MIFEISNLEILAHGKSSGRIVLFWPKRTTFAKRTTCKLKEQFFQGKRTVLFSLGIVLSMKKNYSKKTLYFFGTILKTHGTILFLLEQFFFQLFFLEQFFLKFKKKELFLFCWNYSFFGFLKQNYSFFSGTILSPLL